jgi:hypothetical protein
MKLPSSTAVLFATLCLLIAIGAGCETTAVVHHKPKKKTHYENVQLTEMNDGTFSATAKDNGEHLLLDNGSLSKMLEKYPNAKLPRGWHYIPGLSLPCPPCPPPPASTQLAAFPDTPAPPYPTPPPAPGAEEDEAEAAKNGGAVALTRDDGQVIHVRADDVARMLELDVFRQELIRREKAKLKSNQRRLDDGRIETRINAVVLTDGTRIPFDPKTEDVYRNLGDDYGPEAFYIRDKSESTGPSDLDYKSTRKVMLWTGSGWRIEATKTIATPAQTGTPAKPAIKVEPKAETRPVATKSRKT